MIVRKAILAGFISFFLFTISAYSQIDELMQSANNAYQKGSYELSIEKYNQLIEQGYQGLSLYYNLGNAYYRVGKIGKAILYYEKALKIKSSDKDVAHNLELAKLNTKDKVDTLPQFFLFDIWESALNIFSLTGWSLLVYIFFILVLFFGLFYFFAKELTRQRIYFYSAVAFVVLFLISAALLAVKFNKEMNIKEGIITDTSINVLVSPDPDSASGFIIHEGLKIRVLDKLNDWVKIQLADGKVGWIPQKSFGVI